jgi:uncharacterized membrane protein YeaQ/YmgE (transglycosylase-associated protein family)
MTILAWVVVGLIAGLLAGRIVNRRGHGILLDLTFGVAGALAGGYLFTSLRGIPATGLNVYGQVAAAVGSILAVFINHGIRRAFADKLT